MQRIEDHAGQEYWNENWQRHPLSAPWDVEGDSLRSYGERYLFQYMSDALTSRGLAHAGKSLIEVGCANSAVLPLFNSKLGFSIAGLDYSPIGCAQTEAILAREGISGDVFQTDVFSPSVDLLGRFDVVISLGLVEHFSDTAAVVRTLANLLKPGGVMITSVPNMNGATGLMQKMFDRKVFDIHIPLTTNQLSEAHVSAGLDVECSEYLLPSNFGVCNLVTAGARDVRWRLKKILRSGAIGVSMLSWWIERRLGRLPVSRLFSPYVICVTSKST